ncbi:MAG TPA: 50S ribosomal protein L32e [Candidatus Nitrosocosmicus sp.]|jgi:large subunit ribosomal protein L32e|nr:50S ribosomal protein L32e [Thermoproteota archaeon]HYP42563.1 50S ribosomal protein L32e [Candidatus Nitrosocosmicus sp.]
MVINSELLEQRKKISDRRPKFKRQESWRYKRLATNWRKPDGIDNKMRKQYSGVPPLVKIGYGGPKLARGLHPSGFVDNLVYNVNDLSLLDKNKDAARIAHTVGNKKRLEIIEKAKSLGIKLLNGTKGKTKTETSSEIKNSDKKEQKV